MARRKKGLDGLNETLSTENQEIQEELLKDLVNDQDNVDNPGSDENTEMNNQSNENTDKNVEQSVDTELKPGDRVKIKGDTTTDCMGRRIHNGLRNYLYTVRNVRPDKIACVECLTHVFNIKLTDLEKVK